MEEGDATEEDEDDKDFICLICDLSISIRKRGNSLKLVNYKSAMPSK